MRSGKILMARGLAHDVSEPRLTQGLPPPWPSPAADRGRGDRNFNESPSPVFARGPALREAYARADLARGDARRPSSPIPRSRRLPPLLLPRPRPRRPAQLALDHLALDRTDLVDEQPAVQVIVLVLQGARVTAPRPRPRTCLPSRSSARTRARMPRLTGTKMPGNDRQPSSPVCASSEISTISGLMKTLGGVALAAAGDRAVDDEDAAAERRPGWPPARRHSRRTSSRSCRRPARRTSSSTAVTSAEVWRKPRIGKTHDRPNRHCGV